MAATQTEEKKTLEPHAAATASRRRSRYQARHARDTAPAVANPSDHITIVRPADWRTALDLRVVLPYKYLLYQLTRREVVLRFRQTFLGAAWVVIQPLMTAGILTAIFAWIRAKNPNYQTFVVAMWASVGWGLFQGCVSRGSQSILTNAGLVRKVHFPRMLLPISSCCAVMVDTAVGGVAALLCSLFGGYHLPWRAVLVIPALLGCLALGTGIALAASGISAKYRDVQYIVPFVLQVAIFASPVAFSLASVSGSARRVLGFNPLSGWIQLLRSSVSSEPWASGPLVWSAVATMFMLVLGLVVFVRTERSMSDLI